MFQRWSLNTSAAPVRALSHLSPASSLPFPFMPPLRNQTTHLHLSPCTSLSPAASLNALKRHTPHQWLFFPRSWFSSSHSLADLLLPTSFISELGNTLTLTSSYAWFPSMGALPVQFPMPGVDLLPLEARSYSQIIHKLGNNQILFRKDIDVKTFLFLERAKPTID